MRPPSEESQPHLSQIFKQYSGRVLASLISAYGDFELAERASLLREFPEAAEIIKALT